MRPRNCRITRTVICWLLCGLAFDAIASDDIAPSADIVEAIWRIHRIDLDYRSFSTYYSCAAFEEKVESILRAIGAHERSEVRTRCVGRGVANNIHARLTVAMPTEATPDNVRAATTFDARQQLIARVRKIRLPTPEDISRFSAAWQTMSLSRVRMLQLDAGDCELLRNMRDQVFPQLHVRVLRDDVRCNSVAPGRARPRLDVVALMPVRSEPIAFAPP